MYLDDDKLYIGGANLEAVITPDTEWVNPITKELKYFQHINPSLPITSKDPYVDYQFYSPTGNSIVQTINSTPRWQQYWADQEGSRVSNAMGKAAPIVLDLLTAVDAVATGPAVLEGLYGLYNLTKSGIRKGVRRITTAAKTAPKITEANAVSINISPEELYKALQKQEGYYFMGHGTGRTNVDPEVIFNNGLRIKNGDITNTTSPLSESNLVTWPHANSKEVIILPARAENTMFDSAYGRIPSDWYDASTFKWIDDPGFEGSGFFAVQKPNASFTETVVNGVPGVYTKPSAILGSYNTDTHVLRLNPNSQYKFPFSANTASKITAKNATNITPEQWTAAQDAAIARGDMAEAQRLRDLHFVTNAPNTVIKNVDGTPAHVYHGTFNKGWNSYDKRKFGTSTDNGMYGEGLYVTSDRSYADVYAKGNNADGKYIGEIKDLYVNGERPFYVFNKKDLSPREIVNREDAAYQFGRTLKVQNDIPTPIWDEMTNSDILIETKGTKRPNFAEIVVPRGEKIKLADAVTYDDNGVRIPLGLRDNFKLNDIRYGLIPLGFNTLLGEKNKLNLNKKMKIINKHLVGGTLLPLVTIKPDKKNILLVNYLRKIIPNDFLRNLFYDYIVYNTNNISTNDALNRFILMYKWSGKPKIKKMLKYSDGSWESIKNDGSSNPEYFRGEISLGDDRTQEEVLQGSDLLSELSHAYLSNSKNSKILGLKPTFLNFGKQAIHFNDGRDLYGRSEYDRIGNIEYNTHSMIEPVLTNYIIGNIKEGSFHNALIDHINSILKTKPKSKYPELYDPYSSF